MFRRLFRKKELQKLPEDPMEPKLLSPEEVVKKVHSRARHREAVESLSEELSQETLQGIGEGVIIDEVTQRAARIWRDCGYAGLAHPTWRVDPIGYRVVRTLRC
jgi:hypothetical protein